MSRRNNRPAEPPQETPPPPKRRLWPWLVVAGLIVAAIAGAVLFSRRGPSDIEQIHSLLTLRRTNEAQRQLESLLTEDPSNAEAHVLLGGVLRSQGQRDAALEQFQQAATAAPENAEALVNLGNLLCELNRVQEGIPSLERAAVLTEGSSEETRTHGLALVNLASAYDAVDDLDSADDAWERALRASGGRDDVARAAVGYAMRRHRWTAAVQILQVLARRTPNDRRVHLELAQALIAAGRSEEAIAPLERAVRLDPSDLTAAYNLAHLRYENGERDEARAILERILEASPEHALANQLLPFCRNLVIELN